MVCEQTVEQSARPVTRRGVHHQTHGLVHHQHVLVLENHLQRQAFSSEGQALGRWSQFDLYRLACLDFS